MAGNAHWADMVGFKMTQAKGLPDALKAVALLDNANFPLDQPIVEAAAIGLACDHDTDANFVDRAGFALGVAKHVQEAQSLEKLTRLIERGSYFVDQLYTWRSISRAIPMGKTGQKAMAKEIHEKTVEVMRPEIAKLKEFYKYQEEAVRTFSLEIQRLANKKTLGTECIFQTTKLMLGKMLNVFAVLDRVMGVKSSLKTDFSIFNRAEAISGAPKAAGSNVEQMNMSMFFSTPNSITSSLRGQMMLLKEAGYHYEEVFFSIVDECASLYESGSYILPEDKHLLLKVIAYGLSLTDFPEEIPHTMCPQVVLVDLKGAKTSAQRDRTPMNLSKAFKKDSLYKNKAVDFSRYERIFKTLPVVPLLGDISVALVSFFADCPNAATLGAGKWDSETPAEIERLNKTQYNVASKLAKFREQRDELICALRLANGSDVKGRFRNLSGEKMADLALRGMQQLSNWTATIHELYAWKLRHPATRYTNEEVDEEKSEMYEKAVKFNYSQAEKTALIELIAMIKDVSRMLRSMQIPLAYAVRKDMHFETQKFVQHGIRDALRHAVKKKKRTVERYLNSIRNTCADWLEDQDPSASDPAVKGSKDGAYTPPDFYERAVGPGSTQLFMLRAMVEELACDKDSKKPMSADVNGDSIGPMVEFYQRSYFFAELLNFNASLQKASDLSQLWYREYFLELTQQSEMQRTQFPISMSLPFILVDHILLSKDPSMVEFVLYPLDLYNDAANFALTSFKKQHLYDEVEAEVDLAFDQFIARLTDAVWTHYKSRASSIMLKSQFKNECRVAGFAIEDFGEHRYSTLLKQKAFALLGRSVDINRLLKQRINQEFEYSLNLAIGRFESQDLGHILELESLIQNNRIAHGLLCECLELDPFDQILAVANKNVEQAQMSRIMLHVFDQLCSDVIPNYTFNSSTQRFVRPTNAPEFGSGEPRRSKAPKAHSMYWYGNNNMDTAFKAINSLLCHFVGRPHFACISRLLSYGSLAFCVDEMLNTVETSIKGTLSPYVQSLLQGMPREFPIIPLGKVAPGAVYVLSALQTALKEIIEYPDLQTEFFHAFREIGNGVLVFLMLEQSITCEEIVDLSQSMPFQGTPKSVPQIFRPPPVLPAHKEEIARTQQHLSRMTAHMQLGRITDRLAKSEPSLAKLGKQAKILTEERMCKGLSMFEKALERIQRALNEADDEAGRKVFGTPPPINGVMDIKQCNQFHRLWSVVMLVSCQVAARSKQNTPTAWFGDGMQWAGCTIMALMGQRERFEAFDFTYHIISAWELDTVEHKAEAASGISLVEFVRWAKNKRALNDHIFAVFDRYPTVLKRAAEKDKFADYIPPPGAESERETDV